MPSSRCGAHLDSGGNALTLVLVEPEKPNPRRDEDSASRLRKRVAAITWTGMILQSRPRLLRGGILRQVRHVERLIQIVQHGLQAGSH
jgi:hypothetical protein